MNEHGENKGVLPIKKGNCRATFSPIDLHLVPRILPFFAKTFHEWEDATKLQIQTNNQAATGTDMGTCPSSGERCSDSRMSIDEDNGSN